MNYSQSFWAIFLVSELIFHMTNIYSHIEYLYILYLIYFTIKAMQKYRNV